MVAGTWTDTAIIDSRKAPRPIAGLVSMLSFLTALGPGHVFGTEAAMAGDWIRIRGDLAENPRVIAIADFLNQQPRFIDAIATGERVTLRYGALRCVTVGALLRVWSIAREHGEFVGDDLVLRHSRLSHLDEMAGLPCIGEAMESVGWAREENGVTLPHFMEYNTPMTNAARQSAYRKRQKDSRNASVTDCVTRSNEKVTNSNVEKRERERREEEPPIVPQGGRDKASPNRSRWTKEDLLRVYEAYPRKVARPKALESIRKALDLIAKTTPDNPDPVGWLVGLTERFAKSAAGRSGKYTPHPTTWFNQERYIDDPATWDVVAQEPRRVPTLPPDAEAFFARNEKRSIA